MFRAVRAIDPEAALANNAETEPEAETHADANAETETEAETGTETEAGTGTETETPTETRQTESRSPRLSIGATYAYNLVPNSGYGFRLRTFEGVTLGHRSSRVVGFAGIGHVV